MEIISSLNCVFNLFEISYISFKFSEVMSVFMSLFTTTLLS